ncbi:MAG: outer membrane protein assembly factor BamD [Sphingomicrobium sp.]
MLKLDRSAALILACAATVTLSACSTGSKGKDAAYIARDVNTLYAAAQQTLQSGNYEQAAKLFDEVERQHPYSVWARRAQLMSAFSYYLAHKYNDSISSARRFVTIHPGNAEAPYAQYLIAMSYYEQINDVTREQSTTQQAADAFGELIRRYPDTRYAGDARLKLDLIKDHLGGKDMEIGRFYQRSGQWLAATYRFRNVIDNFQTSSHTPEALERLVECNLALGLPDEARRAAAVLGRNYPGTYWYRQSLRLLRQEQKHTGMWTAAGPRQHQPDAVSTKAAAARRDLPNANSYPDAKPQPKAQ